jgi:serine/threonine-protein kinase
MGPQQIIAHYRIAAKLGEGGMGEVWRATDTKLNRDVAIKILPETFANDPDRMTRFTREAQVLASLNHPNIATIHGVEDRALVMELVEGPTLAERIAQGPIPLDEALPIAKQVAEALEYAHERGVVHRDLKPANVKVTPEGRVKVLDFGLAKALGSEVAGENPVSSPTLTMRATLAGTIIGTAAYMAPEQARGAMVDQRADIWAFGVVLYEMLTGIPMFTGESVSDVVAAVLRGDPDWSALPADSPPSVCRLLRRCLCKDRKKRLRAIGDALLELDEAPDAPPTQPGRRSPILWVIVGALAVALIAAGWFRLRPALSDLSRPVSRWTAILPSPAVTDVALSRDGTLMVYAGPVSGAESLTLRALDRQELRPLRGTGAAVGPVFSPDGQWIAFYEGQRLAKIAVAGGPPITICHAPIQRGRTWGDDDTIVYGTTDGGLMQVPAAGGTPKPLTTPDRDKGELSHQWPWFLPGARAILFTIVVGGSADASQIAVLDRKTGSYHVIVNGGSNGRYAPTGHLIFSRPGELYAAPFDARRLEITGPEVPVIKDISSTNLTGLRYAISDSGLLVYLGQGAASPERTLDWVDRQGNRRPSGLPARGYGDVSLSPDGLRVAASIINIGAGLKWDIWVGELDRGTLTPIASRDYNVSPVWTPDGKRVTFGSYAAGRWTLRRVAADGSGTQEELGEVGTQAYPLSWTPGAELLLYLSRERGPMQISLLPAPVGGVKSKPRPFLEAVLGEAHGDARVSPDGRWIAYASNESGRYEVYVRPFPALSAKVPISSLGGENPHWTGNGRELVYRDPVKGQLMAVDVETTPEFRAGRSRPLFALESAGAGTLALYRGWDVAPDGKRFLVINAPGSAETGVKLQAVVNWFEELRRLAPLGK